MILLNSRVSVYVSVGIHKRREAMLFSGDSIDDLHKSRIIVFVNGIYNRDFPKYLSRILHY